MAGGVGRIFWEGGVVKGELGQGKRKGRGVW